MSFKNPSRTNRYIRCRINDDQYTCVVYIDEVLRGGRTNKWIYHLCDKANFKNRAEFTITVSKTSVPVLTAIPVGAGFDKRNTQV